MQRVFLIPNSDGAPERDSIGESESQFREAQASLAQDESYEAKMEKVRQACQKHFGSNTGTCGGDYGSGDNYAYVERTFDDSVVFKKKGKLWQSDWTEDKDGEVEFSDPVEVRPTYSQVKGSKMEDEY
jgi:hypothetical protein